MKIQTSANKATIICLALGMIFCVTATHCNADIIYPNPPEKGREIVLKNIDLKFLGVSNVEELTMSAPYRCYSVSLNDMAAGHLLSAATPWSWRYLLMKDGRPVGDVLLNVEKDGNRPTYNSIEKSDFTDATLAALQMAEKLPQIKKQDYEVRYLDIMHHHMAVWLHAKSDDIIILLGLPSEPPASLQTHTEAEIIKMLQKEAQREQEMYKNDNGEAGGKGG